MTTFSTDSFMDVYKIDVDNVDLSKPEVKKDVKEQKEFKEFKPRAIDAKTPYTALVRFIPIPVKNEDDKVQWMKEPYITTKGYFLKDPATQQKNYFVSPQTIGETCPIQQCFYTLWRTDDVVRKATAKREFNMTIYNYSLVYVMADVQNPENVGQTMVWRIPESIKKMIEKELNPEQPVAVAGRAPKVKEKVAVWAIDKGKDFNVKIGTHDVPVENPDGSKRNVAMPTYDGCSFETDITSLIIDEHEIQMGESKSMELLAQMYENAPDMSQFTYKPWDETYKQKLNSILDKFYQMYPVNGSTDSLSVNGQVQTQSRKTYQPSTDVNRSVIETADRIVEEMDDDLSDLDL